jgi:hypothetical protein
LQRSVHFYITFIILYYNITAGRAGILYATKALQARLPKIESTKYVAVKPGHDLYVVATCIYVNQVFIASI